MPETKQWVIEVYDKRERWSFEVRVEAPDADTAIATVEKMYPPEKYGMSDPIHEGDER